MMKKVVFLFLATTILFANNAKADDWDDMTQSQAKKVMGYLKKNPFVLDYCDCCSGTDVFLLKIISTESVICSWNTEKFSVKAKALKIGQLERFDFPSAYRTKSMNEEIDYIISMNYTFVYSKVGKWAVPLFKMVAYEKDRNHVCAGATRFPDPADGNDIKDASYKIWFDKNVK